MKRFLRFFIPAVAVIFVLIQLIPVNRTNPPIVKEPVWNSAETKALFDRACADCHSHNTKWPVYAYIAPASLLIAKDVWEGRERFNVSDWSYSEKDKNEIAKESDKLIREGNMPPQIYLPLHLEARLSDAEKHALIDGLKASLK
jgi:hypothetical protein